MESAITFDISPTNSAAPVGVEVWLDQQQLIDCAQVTQAIPVTVTFSEDECERELRIVLKNKTVNHTTVDSSGNIVQDSCLAVNNFKIDDIEADQLVSEQAVYSHSFNSDSSATDHRFYWVMGCNGTVSLRFATPIYIWLLEHM